MAREPLTRLERETIINFNQEESFAEVYTHEGRFIRRLEKMAAEFPDQCQFQEKNEWGGVIYHVPKKLIRIGMPMSEERREAARLKGSLLAKSANKNPLPAVGGGPSKGIGAPKSEDREEGTKP
jgi:hypothetical protein